MDTITEKSKVYKEIIRIVNNHYFVKQRVRVLEHFGFDVQELSMGSGGVGQIKYMSKSDTTRIQIGYGHGKHNYAMCVII